MVTIRRFEDLNAWRSARQLNRRIYEITRCGYFSRDFALRDQIRRASVSVLANIAEGFESRTTALFIELLGRAKGSAGEVRAQLYAALDVGHLAAGEFDELLGLIEETSRQITGLMKYLETHRDRYRLRAIHAAAKSREAKPDA